MTKSEKIAERFTFFLYILKLIIYFLFIFRGYGDAGIPPTIVIDGKGQREYLHIVKCITMAATNNNAISYIYPFI